jgi:hypothetical protein
MGYEKYGDASAVAETWVWNGTAWALLASTTAPHWREEASLAYDPVGHATLLFGGNEAGCTASSRPVDYCNETWLLEADGWHEAQPAHSPAPRVAAFMSTDPRGVILFGGNPGPLLDTWRWSGSDWVQLYPKVAPPRPGLGGFDGLSIQMTDPEVGSWVWDERDWIKHQ